MIGREIPAGTAGLLKCLFHNSYRGLNCKSREFASQGLRSPCCYRVTPLLSTGRCQLHQMRAHPCLRGDEKQRGLPEWVSAYLGWKLQGTYSSKGNRHTGRYSPRSWELCSYTAAVSGIGCASNVLQSPTLTHLDLTADPHLWQAVRSRREQKRPTLCSSSTWETVPCPQRGEGAQDTRPPPRKPLWSQSRGCSVSCAGRAGDLSASCSMGESALSPGQEILAFSSSYLLWDLELFHHAKLVVHLNATLHQL